MTAPLDSTVDALDAGVTSLSPTAGTGLIDQWLDALDGQESLGVIRDGLVDLRDALTAPTLDPTRIGGLMVRLGAQTTAAASTAGPAVSGTLGRLGGLLENAGRRLS